MARTFTKSRTFRMVHPRIVQEFGIVHGARPDICPASLMSGRHGKAAGKLSRRFPGGPHQANRLARTSNSSRGGYTCYLFGHMEIPDMLKVANFPDKTPNWGPRGHQPFQIPGHRMMMPSFRTFAFPGHGPPGQFNVQAAWTSFLSRLPGHSQPGHFPDIN